MEGSARFRITQSHVQASVDEHGALPVQLHEDGNVKITVEDGIVLVNGQPFGNPPAQTADIRGINVQGGGGDNVIGLRGVTLMVAGYAPVLFVQFEEVVIVNAAAVSRMELSPLEVNLDLDQQQPFTATALRMPRDAVSGSMALCRLAPIP